uniref:Uncharacterized protein n=1 Tax=Arundo donax TaxID=35708 RepID=A0A0A8ZIZ8_ARUDO
MIILPKVNPTFSPLIEG